MSKKTVQAGPAKNQEFEILIEDLNRQGEGIGHADGYTLFIKDAVPGDFARVRVTKTGKSFGYARLMELIEPSEDRAEQACPSAKRCGGCQLMAMNYEAQLRFKEKVVKDALTRIGGLTIEPEPIVGADCPFRYRNKSQYPVGEKGGRLTAGFYAQRSHDIIESEDCLLGPRRHKELLRRILSILEKARIPAYDETSGKGLIRHILIREGFATGQIHVCLVINGSSLPGEKAVGQEILALSQVSGVSVNENRTRGNVILGRKTRCIAGDPYLEDRLCGLTFRISPASFYQVNHDQTEKLYGLVREYARLTGKETVFDLYCGAGTIGLTLADAAGQIIGIEIVADAVKNAKENARLNGIENASFFCGAAEELLDSPEAVQALMERCDGGSSAGACETADAGTVVIVDPPRKGCDRKLLDAVLGAAPDRVVYVSCDPATLARDLRILTDGGYQVERARPVDCFCETVHVETVCLLTHS